MYKRDQPQTNRGRIFLAPGNTHVTKVKKFTDSRWKKPYISPDTTTILQYSSGSISDPKGVMLSHRNIVANMEAILKTVHYEHSGPIVGFAPFFHSIGLVYYVLMNIRMECNSIIFSPPAFMEKPLRLFELVTRYKAWLIVAPNSIYDLCAEIISVAGKQITSGLILSQQTFGDFARPNPYWHGILIEGGFDDECNFVYLPIAGTKQITSSGEK